MSEPANPCPWCGSLPGERVAASGVGGLWCVVCGAPPKPANLGESLASLRELVARPRAECAGPSCQHPTHAVGAPDELDYWQGQAGFWSNRCDEIEARLRERAERAEAERDRLRETVREVETEADDLAHVCMAFAFDLGLNAKSVCSFCGAMHGWNDSAGVEQHMLECSRHPMARLQARVAELEAENKTASLFDAAAFRRCVAQTSDWVHPLFRRQARLEAACRDALATLGVSVFKGLGLERAAETACARLRAALEGKP